MPITPPAAPLLFALLTGTPAIVVPPTPAPWDVEAARHVELTADTASQEYAVGISPDLTTTLLFNAPLVRGGVVLEERELFHLVMVDEAHGALTLLPSGALPLGKQLRLTVRFADDGVPASATFRLVVHSTRAEPQVNVYRQPRSAESYQQEVRQERERAERCEAELARTQAEQKGPGGLVGLLESGLVAKKGVEARDLWGTTQQRPEESLRVSEAFSYRAQGRVAVALAVENTSTQPWNVDEDGAALVGKGGSRLRVLRIWQPEPIPPAKEPGRVLVEAEATDEEARDTYVLKLREAKGPRTVTLRGVKFP
ncbi:MAG: DUF2381 family protein [Archangium sp.]